MSSGQYSVTKHTRHVSRARLAVFLLLTLGSAGTEARVWVVSNSGVDSASCGAYASPCRSISQAIENSSNGDQIFVGVGQYGDVSGDVNFTGPGDERPGPMQHYPYQGLGCVLCIDKAVSITSFAGAAETVIQGNLAATQFQVVVGIQVAGVTFGAPGHGFTITGGNVGVGISEGCGGMLTNVYVSGNADINDSIGFEFQGYFDNNIICSQPGSVQISDNTATNNATDGFVIAPNEFYNRVVVRKNLAMGSAGAGFIVSPGEDHGDPSYWAGNITLLNNVAIHNNFGFSLAQIGLAQYNTATNNTVAGFSLDADVSGSNKPFTIFSYNAAVGNRGPGVVLYLEYGDQSGFADFSHNDFIGNDRDRSVTSLVFGVDIGPSAHCGLVNTGYSLTAGVPVGGKQQTLHDFWGTSGGPGANGPGDNAGGACDKNGAITTVVPFSPSAFVFNSLELVVH